MKMIRRTAVLLVIALLCGAAVTGLCMNTKAIGCTIPTVI